MILQRYDYMRGSGAGAGYTTSGMTEHPRGDWVKYSDHLLATKELREALQELMEACEKEFIGPLTEGGEIPCADTDSVMGGTDGESPITFGMIRRARAALKVEHEHES